MRKRGNKLKRILALFLSVVMVVTIVPETGDFCVGSTRK